MWYFFVIGAFILICWIISKRHQVSGYLVSSYTPPGSPGEWKALQRRVHGNAWIERAEEDSLHRLDFPVDDDGTNV